MVPDSAELMSENWGVFDLRLIRIHGILETLTKHGYNLLPSSNCNRQQQGYYRVRVQYLVLTVTHNSSNCNTQQQGYYRVSVRYLVQTVTHNNRGTTG